MPDAPAARPGEQPGPPAASILVQAMPGVFVFLWATGYIGARYGLPYAEPFTFLALRFLIVIAALVPLALIAGARWPRSWREAGHIAVVGVLVQAVYLGGVFAAMARGVPVGLSALIVGLQPLLTAIAVGPLLGERVTARQWLGFVLGLAGVGLVLSEKIAPDAARLFDGFDLIGLGLCVAALLAITIGTLYQKRFSAGMSLLPGITIQYVAAAAAVSVPALLFETRVIDWTEEFAFALAWLSVVLSIGAVTLLMLMIRLGAAAKTASYFYLVPPVAAGMAYLLFDERLGLAAMLGMVTAAAGVALVVITPARRRR